MQFERSRGIAWVCDIEGSAKNLGEPQAVASFKRLRFSKEDLLRYFKGERWGTTRVYGSGGHQRRGRQTESAVIRRIEDALAMAHGESDVDADILESFHKYVEYMSRGPDWAREVIKEETEFIKTGFVKTSETTLEALKERRLSM